MTELIHPTAVIHPQAEVHDSVEVGAYVVIGEQVTLGPRTRVGHHAVIEGWTEIGADNHISAGVVIGTAPQDLKYRGETSGVKICDRNLIREYVTIHRATGDQERTYIGNDNLLMANVHVGHNCHIADGVVIASMAALGGYVHVESQANIGGVLGIHQYVHIGQLAMIGGMSRIIRDVPPFMLVEGHPAQVRALNQVGLKRTGPDSLETIPILKQAFRLLYRSNFTLAQAIAQLEPISNHPCLHHLSQFLQKSQTHGRRGLTPGRRLLSNP